MTLPSPADQTHDVLEYVVQQLQAYFVAKSITAVVDVGWNLRTQQTNQGPGRANRVIFDMPGGEIGAIEYPGGNPRGLYGDRENIRISIWAYDGNDRSSSKAQLWAAKTLMNQVLCGIQLARPGKFFPGKYNRTDQPNERFFGCEFILEAVLVGDMPDKPYGVAKPTNIAITRKLDSTTEAL